MRRLIIVAMATALFLSIIAGIAVATDVGWRGNVAGEMVASNPGYDGLAIDLDIGAVPNNKHFVHAHGRGHYEYQGNAFRLRVTSACVTESEDTVTAWGPAKVTAGSFNSGALVQGDKAYGILSLRLNEDDTVSARAVIATEFFPAIPDVVANNCEFVDDEFFPATGSGTLEFDAK
jgi:hypothetical protein